MVFFNFQTVPETGKPYLLAVNSKLELLKSRVTSNAFSHLYRLNKDKIGDKKLS